MLIFVRKTHVIMCCIFACSAYMLCFHTFMFSQQVAVLKDMRHPNVVNIYEVFKGDQGSDVGIFELEYCAHGDALNVLCRCRTDIGSVPMPLAKCMLTHLLAGISHLHGMWLVHNDLKPDNLLIGQNTEIT